MIVCVCVCVCVCEQSQKKSTKEGLEKTTLYLLKDS